MVGDSGKPVPRTAEFERIKRLPRRVWEDAPDLSDIVQDLSKELRRRPDVELWPIQAAAFRDLHDYDGMLGPITVGGGKTLISTLAATVLAWKRDIRRPLLLVPADLRDKTLLELGDIRRNWHVHPNLRVESVQKLSHPKHRDLLEQMRPDFIIMDECHVFKSPQAACTKRLHRYYSENPVPLLPMSGTLLQRSIKDMWHLTLMTLREVLSPLPIHYKEMNDWANALDVKARPWERMSPGVLYELCGKNEDVLDGFRRRFRETPGVIAGGRTDIGVPLIVQGIHDIQMPKDVRDAIADLEANWELPNGEILMDHLQLHRAMREMACGYWSIWDPAPPVEWMLARQSYASMVRGKIRHNRMGLDTEALVREWCEQQPSPPEEYLDWIAVRDMYTPRRKVVWINDYVLEYASRWALKNKGIVWVESPDVGRRLASGKLPYLGAASNTELMAETGKRSVVCSRRAHFTGKNLQQFNHQLVITPSPRGAIWQQLLGRMHRAGQAADAVHCDVFAFHKSQKTALQSARDDAEWIEGMTGDPQRLAFCDWRVDV